ncbi:hypothetical protein NA57DRAFT_78576 [Rhizodiscina lignyota]|uniref:Conserved oligomeric Golgi complex subunit 2 n=1 Tax=Rhizodiscina lignyota TaxID=1504668 RepID=A0A9P4I5Z2_9PEZI|nr:hypothetical protein NA57DRAFT_78576 [Rhizodiscina lignyota]
MSRFYFSSPSSNPADGDSDIDFNLALDDDLPYPEPISRDPFLSPNFIPSAYLSSLNVRTRHQTLEDLRAELRQRSQDLSKELLDLVNSNYQDFLGLGGSLKGGEEKVEEVRVGLLGFQRGVRELRGLVGERRREVEGLLKEREELWRERQVARGLLDVDARLVELEEKLMLQSAGKKNAIDAEADNDSESEEDDDEDEEGVDAADGTFVPLKRLQRHTQRYLCLLEVMERVGPEHPFIKAQDARIMRARNTLLLDLSTALKQARGLGEAGRGQLMKLLVLFRDLDEEKEAVKVLKGH